MKHLGEAVYILGMKIYKDRSKRLLRSSQSTYIDTMLKWFRMKNFKKNYFSIGHKIFLSKRDCLTTPQEREHMSKISYAMIVDSIIYVMTYTKSDMAYSLGVVSIYQSVLRKNHWKVIKTILKYLRNTKDQWLVYSETDLKLVEFTDSNFQLDYDYSKSASGYIFILNGGAIC